MAKYRAVLAALLLATAPVAAAALSCPCAPCPLERPGTCDSAPSEPCCGEPEEKPACECAHFESPAALPSGYDTSMPPCTMPAEPPVQTVPAVSDIPEAARLPGHDPPSGPIALYLLNLALRL